MIGEIGATPEVEVKFELGKTALSTSVHYIVSDSFCTAWWFSVVLFSVLSLWSFLTSFVSCCFRGMVRGLINQVLGVLDRVYYTYT